MAVGQGEAGHGIHTGEEPPAAQSAVIVRPALLIPARWILALGSVVALGPLAIDMYLPALPALQRDLGASPAQVQSTLAFFFAGLAAGQIFYGPLSDRYGRRWPLFAGLSLFVLASLLCAVARTADQLIALRLLQALGGCAGMVLTRAMVRDRFAPQDMARVLSLLVLVMGIAPILAPLGGSLILQAAGWRAIFVALSLYGVLCLLAVALLIEETHPVERRPRHVTVGSVLRGYRHLLTHRRFMGYALAGGTAQGGMFAYISVSAFVFIDVYGFTPAAFSVLFGLNAAGLIAASQLNRWLLRRWPAQVVLQRALQTYAGAALLTLVAATTGWGGVAGIALPLWLAISSLGFTFPNSVAAAMAPFGDRAGAASGLLGTLQFTVAGAASFLVGRLYDGTALAMAAVISSCALAALLLLRLARRD